MPFNTGQLSVANEQLRGPFDAGGDVVPIEDEGVEIVAAPTAINFVGDGVTASDVAGVATVTIPGGGGVVPVQDEGGQVVAAPTAFNFVGDGVTATDVGGVATVTIPGGTQPDLFDIVVNKGGRKGVTAADDGYRVKTTSNNVIYTVENGGYNITELQTRWTNAVDINNAVMSGELEPGQELIDLETGFIYDWLDVDGSFDYSLHQRTPSASTAGGGAATITQDDFVLGDAQSTVTLSVTPTSDAYVFPVINGDKQLVPGIDFTMAGNIMAFSADYQTLINAGDNCVVRTFS